LFGEIGRDIIIKSEWSSVVHQDGYGWKEPGKWLAGDYKVNVLIDGIKIGESIFKIYDNLTEDPGVKTLDYLLDVWEGGEAFEELFTDAETQLNADKGEK